VKLLMNGLELDNEQLAAALSGLGAVGKSHPELVDVEQVVGFTCRELLPALPGSRDDKDDLLDEKLAALKAITNMLLGLAKHADDAEDTGVSPKERIRGVAVPFVRQLLTIIESSGDLTGTRAESQTEDDELSDCRKLTQVAATSLIKLCSSPMYDRLLAPTPKEDVDRQGALQTYEPFLNLALVAHHEDADVRQNFVDYVFKRLAANQLPFSYISILVLCASHDKEEANRVKVLIMRLIARQRKVWAQRQAMQGTQRLNSQFPEVVLANLLYLLSHHPDFSDDVNEQDEKTTSTILDYFLGFPRFYLECLMRGQEEGHNFELIHHVIETVRNCQDVRDPKNMKIYKMVELTQMAFSDLYQGKSFKG
jgi:hypothetical protein